MSYLDINLINFTTNILDYEDLNIKKDTFKHISLSFKLIIIKCLESSNIPENLNNASGVYSAEGLNNYLNNKKYLRRRRIIKISPIQRIIIKNYKL
jgi:hypothetical protein